jgi:hypothetical protein
MTEKKHRRRWKKVTIAAGFPKKTAEVEPAFLSTAIFHTMKGYSIKYRRRHQTTSASALVIVRQSFLEDLTDFLCICS